MKIFGLKNCDTCRKAAKALGGVEIQDVRLNPLEGKQIERFLAEFGDALINTRSATWRGLDEHARALPKARLLRENPALMKRPVIEAEGKLYLGWGEETQKSLL